MDAAKVIDFVNDKKDVVVGFGVKATSVTVGTASVGTIGGATGASLGTGIGFVIGGPVGAGIGFAIGSVFGVGSGATVGAIGGNKVGKVIVNSLKEDK
jgi:hypothetical protein